MRSRSRPATADGQKEMMATSVGLAPDHWTAKPIATMPGQDHGADPIGDGRFRMVPSGDVVDYAERMRRLPPRR